MKKVARLPGVGFALLGLILLSGPLRAQSADTLQNSKGTNLFFRDPSYPDSIVKLSDIAVGAAYVYVMNYDSGRVHYVVSDLRLNDTSILYWNAWTDNTDVRDLADSAVSARTKEVVFTAGDSISIYREFFWDFPGGPLRTAESYHALDTLAYSIVLVRVSDGSRYVIDSILVLPETGRDYVAMAASRPLAAVAKIKVPSAWLSTSVYLKANVYARGSGTHYFQRVAYRTYNMSHRALDSAYQDYCDRYSGPGLGKRTRRQLDAAMTGEFTLRITPSIGGRSFDVGVDGVGDDPYSVVIYSASGELVCTLVTDGIGAGVYHGKETSIGSYFVALVRHGTLLKAVRINIAD
jgi:hypothetical protein